MYSRLAGWGRCSDSLRAERSGDWILVEGEILRPRPGRPWGPPSLLFNGYRVCFPGVKRPGRGVDHPNHIWLRGSRKGRAIALLPLWIFMVCSGVNFVFSSVHVLQTMLARSAPWQMTSLRQLVVVAERFKQLKWLWVADVGYSA